MKSAIFLLLVCFFSTEALALGKFFRPRSDYRGRNTSGQAEGRVEHCTTGTCYRNNLRSEGLRPIHLEGGLGLGMQRVLTGLYGTCAAKDSLNSIQTFGNNERHFRRYLSTKSPAPPGYVHIPGIDSSVISAGFDTVREVNPNRPAMGPYAAAARGARMCQGAGVSVGRQNIDPARVPKMFGNGAAGRMIGDEFSSFSCASSDYLSQLTEVQRAFNCGLGRDSAPAIALDCAELIGAAAVASCHKLHPDQKIDAQGIRLGNGRLLSTRSLEENACLRPPGVSAEAPINSGDIFVIKTHSIVITEVGNDPFGIQRAGSNCNSINADDLNFSFAQSSSHRELGPIQSTTQAFVEMQNRDGYGVNAFPLKYLVSMARTMCRAKLAGRTSGESKTFIGDYPAVRQMRHNSGNPACSYPEGECPKTSGSDCAEYCGV